MALHSLSRGKSRGLTMIEVVASTLLVGLVLMGAMNGVGSVLKTWRAAAQQHDGLALDEQLMAEILQQRYEEPDTTPQFGTESPEKTNDRVQWDDLDDYDGWSAAPEDKDGNPLSGFENWSRSVTVAFAQLGDLTQTAATEEGLKRITVTAVAPNGQPTVLVAYRSERGVLEMPLDTDVTLPTWVSDEIEVGERTLQGGVCVRNHAQDQ